MMKYNNTPGVLFDVTDTKLRDKIERIERRIVEIQTHLQSIEKRILLIAQRVDQIEVNNNDSDEPSIVEQVDTSRQPSSFDIRVAQELHRIITSRYKVGFKTSIRQWADQIRLMRQRDKIAKRDIREAIQWYEKHIGEKFTPVVLCAATFRQKYLNGQIPAAIQRTANQKREEEDQEVMMIEGIGKVSLKKVREFNLDRYQDPEVYMSNEAKLIRKVGSMVCERFGVTSPHHVTQDKIDRILDELGLPKGCIGRDKITR